VLQENAAHLGVGQVQPGDERRQQPGAVGHEDRTGVELEGENLRQDRADGLGGRNVSSEQLVVGVVATAHSTGDVEQSECRRTRTYSGLHRDPDRVKLQPTRAKVTGQRLCNSGLARAGRASDKHQALPHRVIVSAAARDQRSTWSQPGAHVVGRHP